MTPKRGNNGSSALSQADLKNALRDIFQHYGYDPDSLSVPARQDIVERLNVMVGQTWTHRYILNFLGGKINAGEEFADAILRLESVIDGTPVLQIKTHTVSVQATDDVRPGSFVIGDSRHCDYPGCAYWFVPDNYFRKYCPEHRPKKKSPHTK